MINPANYYNPFAKYNYVSKTRGVYFPKEAQPVEKPLIQKVSVSIYDENYDAETDVLQAIDNQSGDNSLNDKLLGLLNKFFPDVN